jgi:hypothetical protein
MGRHELLDGGLLLGSVHLHPWPPRRDVLAGTVRDLPYRGRGLAHHLGDLLVRRLEHLAQHEHCPLGRTEGLQHGEHRDRDVLAELGVLGHIGTGEQRLGQPFPDVLLPAAGHRSKPVQRLPGDHPDQIGARVMNLGLVDVGPPQPGFLHHVLGVGGRAEQLVGDGEEQAAVGDERVVGHAVEATACDTRAGYSCHRG